MRRSFSMLRSGEPWGLMFLLGARLAFGAAQAVVLWGVFAKGGASVSVLPWDKAEHFAAFLGLMLLALPAAPGRSPAVLALGLAVEGGLIELVQALPIVNRDADVGDWVADLAGIAAVLAVLAADHSRRWLSVRRAPTCAAERGVRGRAGLRTSWSRRVSGSRPSPPP